MNHFLQCKSQATKALESTVKTGTLGELITNLQGLKKNRTKTMDAFLPIITSRTFAKNVICIKILHYQRWVLKGQERHSWLKLRKVKSYLCYITITSQNVSFEAHVKNFLFCKKVVFCNHDIQADG